MIFTCHWLGNFPAINVILSFCTAWLPFSQKIGFQKKQSGGHDAGYQMANFKFGCMSKLPQQWLPSCGFQKL